MKWKIICIIISSWEEKRDFLIKTSTNRECDVLIMMNELINDGETNTATSSIDVKVTAVYMKCLFILIIIHINIINDIN